MKTLEDLRKTYSDYIYLWPEYVYTYNAKRCSPNNTTLRYRSEKELQLYPYTTSTLDEGEWVVDTSRPFYPRERDL